MKKYRAIFFDWDGTAVETRKAPVNEVMPLIVKLLENGVILVIISGTTYEKIAHGQLHKHVPNNLLPGLFLGLGRGAYNYGFDQKCNLITLHDNIPSQSDLIKIHEISYEIHKYLLKNFQLHTDIIFSRPNYCKIDLLVDYDRGDSDHISEHELDLVNNILDKHNMKGGVQTLVEKSIEFAEEMGLKLKVTTDAKFLEIGLTTKADNVAYFLKNIVTPQKINIQDCSFWGDEFSSLGLGIKGSDAEMIIEESAGGDFFDVSEQPFQLPNNVIHVGGGVDNFLNFLRNQIEQYFFK